MQNHTGWSEENLMHMCYIFVKFVEFRVNSHTLLDNYIETKRMCFLYHLHINTKSIKSFNEPIVPDLFFTSGQCNVHEINTFESSSLPS